VVILRAIFLLKFILLLDAFLPTSPHPRTNKHVAVVDELLHCYEKYFISKLRAELEVLHFVNIFYDLLKHQLFLPFPPYCVIPSPACHNKGS